MTKKKQTNNSDEKKAKEILISTLEKALNDLHNHFVANSTASNGTVSTTFIKASFDVYLSSMKKGAGIKE